VIDVIPANMAALILKGAFEGFALALVMLAQLYVQPATAVWMWPLTLLALITGGPSGKRRKR
jgi:hypothetical protein